MEIEDLKKYPRIYEEAVKLANSDRGTLTLASAFAWQSCRKYGHRFWQDVNNKNWGRIKKTFPEMLEERKEKVFEGVKFTENGLWGEI